MFGLRLRHTHVGNTDQRIIIAMEPQLVCGIEHVHPNQDTED